MKKLVFIFAVLVIALMANPILFVDASPEKPGSEENVEENEHNHKHHRLIDEKQIEELSKKGFSKHEIFMGAILAKKSNKSIDEVLSIYKDSNTWESTAEKLGVNVEEFKRLESMVKWDQFIKENEEAVIEHLAAYSKKSPEAIKTHLNNDIPLRFLIGAAAMAKLSNKDLDEIISLKKDGQSFHEILKTLSIKHEDLHKELNEFKSEVQGKIKEKTQTQQ